MQILIDFEYNVITSNTDKIQVQYIPLHEINRINFTVFEYLGVNCYKVDGYLYDFGLNFYSYRTLEGGRLFI